MFNIFLNQDKRLNIINLPKFTYILPLALISLMLYKKRSRYFSGIL